MDFLHPNTHAFRSELLCSLFFTNLAQCKSQQKMRKCAAVTRGNV
jgi:hypothetical protein